VTATRIIDSPRERHEQLHLQRPLADADLGEHRLRRHDGATSPGGAVVWLLGNVTVGGSSRALRGARP
jgi:hypothetical protein